MIKQRIVFSSGIRLLSKPFNLISAIFVARYAGPEVVGVLAYGVAFASLFQPLLSLGLGDAHISLINKGEKIEDCIATFRRYKTVLTIIYLCVTTFAVLIIKYLLNGFDDETTAIVILITMTAVAIESLLRVQKTTFIAQNQQVKAYLPEFIKTIVVALGKIVLVVLGFKVISLASTKLAAAILIVPIYIYFFKEYTIGNYDKHLVKKYFRIQTPLLIVGISQVIIYKLDRIFLELFSSMEMVGYYAISFSIIQFMNLIQTSIAPIFFALLTKDITKKNYDSINKRISEFRKFLLLFILPLILVILIYSDTLITLVYSEKFAPAAPIFVIITFNQFITLFNTPIRNSLFGLSLFNYVAKVWIISAIVFVTIAYTLLNINIINNQGINIALSLLATTILQNSLFNYKVKKYDNNIRPKFYLKLTVFLVIACGGILTVKILFNSITIRIISILICLSLFWFGGLIIKTHSKEEFKKILELINYKKMKNYIKNEVGNKKNGD